MQRDIRAVFLVQLLCSAAFGQTTREDKLAGRDWPQFNGDPQRTCWSPNEFHQDAGREQDRRTSFDILWKRPFKDMPNVWAQVVVADETCYLANMDGVLTAMDRHTGQTRWEYKAASAIGVTPAVVDGRVHFGDFTGVIATLDGEGRKLWEYQAGGAIYSSPLVVDGKVFVGSNDRHLYAFEAATGRLLWSFDADGKIFSSPAYLDGQVHFSAENMFVYCLDAATGKLVWKQKIGGESNRANHPLISKKSGIVVYASVPRFTGNGGNLSWLGGSYRGSEVDPKSDKPADKLHAYYLWCKEHPEARSVWIFDARTGREITGFRFGERTYDFFPFHFRYMNGAPRVVLHVPSDKAIWGNVYAGGFFSLDMKSHEIEFVHKNICRGDENMPFAMSGNRLIATYGRTVEALDVVAKKTFMLNGTVNDGRFIDAPASGHSISNHYIPSTGDAGSCFSGNFIVGSDAAYYVSYGWLYCLKGTVKEVKP